jgi:hypothetical protein
MKQDRFFIGILVAIAALVVLSLVLFYARKDTQTYLPEDTPEAIVHNYALALHQRDYERAYGYLAEKNNKPTFDQFRQAFLSNQLNLRGSGIEVGKVDLRGQEAYVDVSVVHTANGPFADSYRSTETAVLVRQDGEWRVSQMPYPYWGWDWYQTPPKPAPTF